MRQAAEQLLLAPRSYQKYPRGEVENVLKREGYGVVFAGSGEEARKEVTKNTRTQPEFEVRTPIVSTSTVDTVSRQSLPQVYPLTKVHCTIYNSRPVVCQSCTSTVALCLPYNFVFLRRQTLGLITALPGPYSGVIECSGHVGVTDRAGSQ